MTSPLQQEPPYEHRLALSRVLMEIYTTIDHDAMFAHLHATGNQDADADSEASGPMYPEILSMQLILADTLQYLQLVRYGYIAALGAREYTHADLIANIRFVLDGFSAQAEDEDVAYIVTCLMTVLTQLNEGNYPIEPVATYLADE